MYESLCPDSIKFINEQLYPAWNELKPYVNIKFVPFGKSSVSGIHSSNTNICNIKFLLLIVDFARWTSYVSTWYKRMYRK